MLCRKRLWINHPSRRPGIGSRVEETKLMAENAVDTSNCTLGNEVKDSVHGSVSKIP